MLGNRYQLGNEIGAGGMGTVYLGTDSLFQQTVAIKHLKSDLVQPQLIERFKREGEALRDLNHPNIVKLLDTLEHDGAYYLVMEYVAGGDLSDLLKSGKLPIERCLKLALDLADALTRAHKLDIIHRDLKPANVLLAEDGTLRLTDFGVAYIGNKQRVTDTDAIVGTVDYLAPESLDGGEIDPRADIWSFGVMLYEMLTGERPFTGATIAQTLMAILTHPIPDLEALRPDATIGLVDLVYRMLEKDRNTRIRSVRQVGLELEDILHGRTTHTPPQTRFAPDTPDYLLRPKHNLPTQTTPFVGREAELAELTKLLDDPKIRLLTILAPGGMGKTRLALELAAQYITPPQPLPEASGRGFNNGVYFVELAPLSDPANIPAAIAEATSYQFQSDGREPKQQILDFLGNKNILLVLDNYEHLMEGAALVTEILKAAPQVKILATSRQRLNQLSETLFNLQGMDFPAWETPADALEYAAVKLFMQSARRAKPDFELTHDNMDAIARICKLVQGMPLGIVMAAAWLALLAAEEIAVEIANSIDFLASDMGEIPERQRSIRAVFDYSWDLMNEAEQQVFIKLSVFRGGFTRQAAQSMTGATLQQLMSLVNKSLIQRDSVSGRYEIHELLRQYAAEKAEQSGQVEAIADAHMTYYANALQERESHLKGHRQLEALNDIEADFENVRVAWIWAVEHDYFDTIDRMQASLESYCYLRARFQDGLMLLDMAVQRLSKISEAKYKAIYGRLLSTMGIMFALSYQLNRAHEFAVRGLEIARETGERRDIAIALLRLCIATPTTTQTQQEQTWAEEALTIFRELGDKPGEARVLRLLGYLVAKNRQCEQSDLLWREALRIYRELGDREGISIVLMNLGATEATYRHFEKAKTYLYESLTLQRELHSPSGLRWILGNLSSVFNNSGDFDEAEKAAREALRVAEEANHRPDILLSLLVLADIKTTQTDYTTALKLTTEAEVLLQSTDDPSLESSIKLHQGLALCGQGDYEVAEKALYNALHNFVRSAHNSELEGCVFGFSLVLALHYQQHERALAIASLLAHHTTVASWWEDDPLAQRLVAYLKQQLPDDVYAAAWERGKSLDLDTVIQELLAEFGATEA